jgi:hypothetical protein
LDFDGNAISGIHGAYAQAVVDHGLVYQVTGDARQARKAREILLAYAANYLRYPLHDNRGKPGRGGHVASQSLTEASWLITFTQGADLVWMTLSEADCGAITEQVLRPALEQVILPSRLGIHNIQCRLNSAIGLVGFLLGDAQLIARAIEDPTVGFRQQIEKGVLADGMWTEGSSGYHFFTIAGLWPLAEAARHGGIDLDSAKFRSMFDGPLALAMPDLVLPNFNDSGPVPLQAQADLYELAFAHYGVPAYAPLLARSARRGQLALLYGATNLPAASHIPDLGSRNSSASGYAVLQQGPATNPTWLCLKYGPHGGGHGHPDKNHFILYAQGQVVAPDGGTHAYGSPLHAAWDKATLAHNTLVVDQASQKPATGRCLAFGSERGVDFCVIDAGPIYPGVRFIRTAAMLTPSLVVFVDQVQADAPHTFDLAYHQMGTWEKQGNPWTPPATAGYKHLSDATSRTPPFHERAGQNLVLKTRIADGWSSAITLAGGEPTEVITGYGILKTTEDRVPMLIQRRRAQRTVFVWAVSLDGAPVALSTREVNDASGKAIDKSEAILVQATPSTGPRLLLINPHRQTVTALLPDSTSWRSDAVCGVR